MMTVVDVGKSKQKNMCCLNANDMDGEERVRWRGVLKMNDDMQEYDVIKGYQ